MFTSAGDARLIPRDDVMDDLRPDTRTVPAVATGWWITFLVLGALTALDGAWTLLFDAPALAATVESLGKTLAGPLLAVHGALGLRNGRGLDGAAVATCALLGVGLYLGGMVAGSAWWAAVSA